MPSSKKKKPHNRAYLQQKVHQERKKDIIQQLQLISNKIISERTCKESCCIELEQLNDRWDVKKKLLTERKQKLRDLENEHENENFGQECYLNNMRTQIKHLIYQHQNEIALLKNTTVAKYEKADEYAMETSDISAHAQKLIDNEMSHKSFMQLLFNTYISRVGEIHASFKLNICRLAVDFASNFKTIQLAKESLMKGNAEDLEIVRQKISYTQEQRYEKMLNDMRSYYSDRLYTQLKRIQELKLDLSNMKRLRLSMEKHLNQLDLENKSIVQPLSSSKNELGNLQNQTDAFREERQKLEQTKIDLKIDEKRLKTLQWHYEVIFQKMQLLTQETHDARKKLHEIQLERMLTNHQGSYLLSGEKLHTLYTMGMKLMFRATEMLKDTRRMVNDFDSCFNSPCQLYEGRVSLSDLQSVQLCFQKLVHNIQ